MRTEKKPKAPPPASPRAGTRNSPRPMPQGCLASSAPPWPRARAIDRFEGNWNLHRSCNEAPLAEGFATFTRIGPGVLRYHEQLRVRLPDGSTINGTRRYLFEHREDGFAVYFDEPGAPARLFHAITLEPAPGHDGLVRMGLHGRGVHDCGDDVYDSTYRLMPDGSFTIAHRVSGPAKDHVLHTIYLPHALQPRPETADQTFASGARSLETRTDPRP